MPYYSTLRRPLVGIALTAVIGCEIIGQGDVESVTSIQAFRGSFVSGMGECWTLLISTSSGRGDWRRYSLPAGAVSRRSRPLHCGPHEGRTDLRAAGGVGGRAGRAGG